MSTSNGERPGKRSKARERWPESIRQRATGGERIYSTFWT